MSRQGKKARGSEGTAQLEQIHWNAAGIDVGSEEHWVAVPPDRGTPPVRKFGAFTVDLEALADWLRECRVDTVVMESTGVYWVPLFELLEARGFEVLLVDPRKLKSVPGRKTDALDCQWLQQLHTFGLLSGAFRPRDAVCALRAYVRQRSMLVESAARHVQHMQKALAQMNVKLEKALSDITGKTGLAILDAILAGERDPRVLARLRDERCRHDEETIAKALRGNWRDEHLFALRQARRLYAVYGEQIAECDRQIEAHLASFPDQSDGTPLPADGSRRTHASAPSFDARTAVYRAAGVDLTRIDGIQGHTALKLLSEIGTDMSRWKTHKHFASWLGLCPNNRVSGGKRLSSRVLPSANRAAAALRLAAASLHRSQTALGAYLRRMKARLGGPAAVTATAHKLARLVYEVLKHGWTYVDKGVQWYETQYRDRILTSLSRRAKELGFQLVPSAPNSDCS
ncbi:MAG TPA: IS110 family transposase [Pirellulales bacterium]|nr:IS110 family transposase [Pirellulales bacterium]